MVWLVGDDGAMAEGCETGPVCKKRETDPKFYWVALRVIPMLGE